MSRITWVFVCLVACLALSSVKADTTPGSLGPIDVYLIGGQSNATGQGYMSNLPKDFVINTDVLLFNSGPPHLDSGAAPLTWVPLRQASESPIALGLNSDLEIESRN
jgi:hypothetical protein